MDFRGAHESSLDEAGLSDGSLTRKRKRNRFLDCLKKKVTTEIGEADREYNSALLSSAAYERLFSTADLLFVPKRSHLSDSNFDRLLFLNKMEYLLETGNFAHQKLANS
ncbi:hypothetical protein DAPPUDRAFT_248413 [Daphnia pulex]|uniref:Uncharacterized protein n=1 Tax=Daphnia pulex TaxID=6669 RepID=E9GUL8_DAPPU|nr:hypothetical protein DAPPUDRAFT_248413 [Daphnia pulex]|eukprot:EFX76750.1 hypothetical protein DAPPUDRAFT_248413 [Daphnia pulex]